MKVRLAKKPAEKDQCARLSKSTVGAYNVEEHAKCKSSWIPLWPKLIDSSNMNSFSAATVVLALMRISDHANV